MTESADVISMFTMEKCLTANEAIIEAGEAELEQVLVVGWMKGHGLFMRSGGDGSVLTRAEALYLMEMAKLNSLGQLD